MSRQFSTAVRNARLAALPATVGNGPLLNIYSGTEPANCAAALAGNTLLASIQLPATWTGAPANGSMLQAGTWTEASANASGTASFYRIYDSTGTTCHEQGTVTATGGGGDLTIGTAGAAITAGASVTFTGVNWVEANA